MQQKLKVSQWDPTTIRPNSVIAVIGRRGSGKSSIVLTMLYQMRHMFDVVFAFCPTVDVARKFQKIMPDSLVWNQTQSEEMLDAALRTFTEILASGKKRKALIVSDDTSFDAKFFKSMAAKEAAYNGRNCELTWLITAQGNVDFPPAIRGNIDYVLIASENVNDTKVKLYKYYAGVFSSQQQFNKVLARITVDYTVLVIDQTQTTNDMSKCVFFFRGKEFKDLPPFRLCRDCYYVLDQIYNVGNKPKEVSTNKKIIIQETALTDFTKI